MQNAAEPFVPRQRQLLLVSRAIDRTHAADADELIELIFAGECFSCEMIWILKRERSAIFKAESLIRWILALASRAVLHGISTRE